MEIPNTNTEKSAILEGIISIEAALNGGKRRIYRVYADKNKFEKRDRKTVRFLSLLKKSNIEYKLCDRAEIDKITEGETHGGFAAEVSERKYESFENMLRSLNSTGYAVYLDGVEDPFNFGYSIRNLYAFGCENFIVPERNWLSCAGIVAKASAGASERCSIAVAPTDDVALEIIKKSNTKLLCAGLSKNSISIYDFSPSSPFILFIGGEKRGISKIFFENADSIVHIPYANPHATYSLPTASCAAVFGSFLAKTFSEK